MSVILNSKSWSFPFCPNSPDWDFNWYAIVDEFFWIANLKDCPQNPVYHAEGDVLIHTKMVCEALINLSAWRDLNAIDRSFSRRLYYTMLANQIVRK